MLSLFTPYKVFGAYRPVLRLDPDSWESTYQQEEIATETRENSIQGKNVLSNANWKRKSNVIEQRGKSNRVQDCDYGETGCQAPLYWLPLCVKWLAWHFPFKMLFHSHDWCLKSLPFVLLRESGKDGLCCACCCFPDSSLAMRWTTLLWRFLILTFEQGEKAEEPCPEADCVCGRSCLGAISKARCHSHFFDPHDASWHFMRSWVPGNSSCFLRARTGSRIVVFPFSLFSVLPTYLNKSFVSTCS